MSYKKIYESHFKVSSFSTGPKFKLSGAANAVRITLNVATNPAGFKVILTRDVFPKAVELSKLVNGTGTITLLWTGLKPGTYSISIVNQAPSGDPAEGNMLVEADPPAKSAISARPGRDFVVVSANPDLWPRSRAWARPWIGPEPWPKSWLWPQSRSRLRFAWKRASPRARSFAWSRFRSWARALILGPGQIPAPALIPIRVQVQVLILALIPILDLIPIPAPILNSSRTSLIGSIG